MFVISSVEMVDTVMKLLQLVILSAIVDLYKFESLLSEK